MTKFGSIYYDNSKQKWAASVRRDSFKDIKFFKEKDDAEIWLLETYYSFLKSELNRVANELGKQSYEF